MGGLFQETMINSQEETMAEPVPVPMPAAAPRTRPTRRILRRVAVTLAVVVGLLDRRPSGGGAVAPEPGGGEPSAAFGVGGGPFQGSPLW